MRKVVLAVTAGMLVASLTPSHASPIASCTQQAGVTGVPDNIAIGGVCQALFETAEPAAFTITLTPGTGFTGMIQATLTSPTAPSSAEVRGVYVAGQLVEGEDSTTTTELPADANWKLQVKAGPTTPMSTPLPPAQQVTLPGAAVGEFGAEIAVAAAPPAE